MHEIVTLQFGQQANYAATHYWNAQESYFTYSDQDSSPVDHDISFRAGIGADGQETYTPRTVIYDLKGAFGTLRRENALYALQQQQQGPVDGWSGVTVPLQLSPIAPSAYQQALDRGASPLPRLSTETVRFWSDYNHLFYHPRSIVQLNEYELNSSLMPFERWATGEELFASLDREHDLLDRDLRPWLEECDQLQGLQILTGTDDAWGGFAAEYLKRVQDELGKGCRWVFGLQEGGRVTRERGLLQMVNAVQSVVALDECASLHVPVTSVPRDLPGYLKMDEGSRWHTSALQAAMIESVTLPTRLRRDQSGRASFDDLETTLSNEGDRRMVAAGLTMEDPSKLDETAAMANGTHDPRITNGMSHSRHDTREKHLDIDFTPSFTSASADRRTTFSRPHTFSRVESLRGPWRSEEEVLASNADSRDRFVADPGHRETGYQTQLLFPLLSSYPDILQFSGRGSVEKVAVKASLSTSTAVAESIRRLEHTAGRLLPLEDRSTICDGLISMAEVYEDGWSDDESGDEDE